MPRGQPDFGAYQQKSVGATLSDMAELAARLGSIVTYDRRGDVIDLDDFESTLLRWNQVDDGAGSYAILDNTSVKSGSQSVRLHIIDTGMAFVRIERGISLRGSDKLGLELSFSSLTDTADIRGGVVYYDGSYSNTAAWRLLPAAEEVQVYDHTVSDWVKIADTGTFLLSNFAFYTVKIVFDITTKKYVRLMISADEYGIADYTLYQVALVSAIYVKPYVQLSRVSAGAADVWVDDIILTQNEL